MSARLQSRRLRRDLSRVRDYVGGLQQQYYTESVGKQRSQKRAREPAGRRGLAEINTSLRLAGPTEE